MRKLVRLSLGFTLLIVGFILSLPLVPGPGIALMILGLVVLSEHVPWARRLLVWAKRKAKRTRQRFGVSRG
ncbi:MAG: PGPGW domain-containing protein [Bryobacterales bacterium]|nr:PGPGW domain-containing protein [Bryobacteraceae bacterium]MDW8354725.1 PGPGW domain-containing protein [Bryobacterales bacterium]